MAWRTTRTRRSHADSMACGACTSGWTVLRSVATNAVCGCGIGIDIRQTAVPNGYRALNSESKVRGISCKVGTDPSSLELTLINEIHDHDNGISCLRCTDDGCNDGR